MALQQEYEQLKQQISQYDKAGDYVGLAREMDRFLELTGELYGLESPEYATTLNDYGGIHRDIGNFEKAEQAFLQAAEKIAVLQSAQHPDYGSVLNNLAGLYRLMKDYEKAEAYFQKTLEIYKQALGEDHFLYISGGYKRNLFIANIRLDVIFDSSFVSAPRTLSHSELHIILHPLVEPFT